MTQTKQENPFVNLAFNVLLPVVILNQLSKHGGENGPLWALLLGLSIPIAYGTFDLIRNRRKNWLSLFGIINVAFTGGLALLELDGFWFAVKEAAFPFLIGVAVLVSQWLGHPFFKKLFWNPAVFDVDRIEKNINDRGLSGRIDPLLARANLIFAFSFFISSALNFYLALRIFQKIDPSLDTAARKIVLNEQIAKMTWQGYVVIALPLMVLMMGLIWYLVRQLRALSGLKTEEIFKTT